MAIGISISSWAISRHYSVSGIVFALGVKFLVLILGALGYANMWAAVFADVGVSIIAILNAIRAMRVKLPDMPAGSTNQD